MAKLRLWRMRSGYNRLQRSEHQEIICCVGRYHNDIVGFVSLLGLDFVLRMNWYPRCSSRTLVLGRDR